MANTDDRTCSRCGDVAEFLVAGSDETQAPGRLLVYCLRCRAAAGSHLVLALPLVAFDVDPDGVLAALYRTGIVRTLPEAVREVIGVEDGTWSDVARAALRRDGSLECEAPALDVLRAVAPFARSIHAKAMAVHFGAHSPVQQQRLRESITVDLRKCSDVLSPDLVPAAVSTQAANLAEGLNIDLAKQTWQTQTKFDPTRAVFHFEHFHPVGEIRALCLSAESVSEITQIILDRLRVAWITKDEDKRLRELGFSTKRPHPTAAYEAAAITLLPQRGRH